MTTRERDTDIPLFPNLAVRPQLLSYGFTDPTNAADGTDNMKQLRWVSFTFLVSPNKNVTVWYRLTDSDKETIAKGLSSRISTAEYLGVK